MRLSVRWQLALVLGDVVAAADGAHRRRSRTGARAARSKSIRFNLETLASLSAEKLERLLLDRHQACAAGRSCGFMQDDTVTGDADGRILQFLQDAKRNFDLYQEFWVANAAGQVIASTLPGAARPRSRRSRRGCRRRAAATRGSALPGLQEFTGRVGMPIAFPLRASFDRARTVGVLVAVLDWPKVVETLQGVKVVPEGQSDRGYLVLADARGVVLSAPPFFTGWEARQDAASARLGLEAVEQLPASAAGRQHHDRRARRRRTCSGYASSERAAVHAGHLAHGAADAHRRRVRAAAAA